MAKAHWHTGPAMEAITTLDDATIGRLALAAAEGAQIRLGWPAAWATVRHEATRPGVLTFSVRSANERTEKAITELMAFEMRLTNAGHGATKLRTAILRYKTMRAKYLGLIPISAKEMLGLPNYQLFIENFICGLRETDPAASAVPDARAVTAA